MPENQTNPTDTTQPQEPARRPRRNPALLNQAQIQALTKAEQICLTARRPDYATPLAVREVPEALIQTLLEDITRARQKSAEAVHGTTGKESATLDERQCEEDLLAALQEVQAAAKQKYARTNRPLLQDYYVGKRLDASRPALEQYSQAILEKLSADTLPGITPEKVAELTELRRCYIEANLSQTGAQSGATATRAELADMVQSIIDRRIGVQYAADAQWPHGEPAHAGTRREFHLLPDRPFSSI